ncbi:MAG: hypothetical protein ACOC9T_00285 [Myxococcota bacterium]
MPTRRERIVRKTVEALDGAGKPDGATVHRYRVRPIERDDLPAYVVYPSNPPMGGRSEAVQRMDHDPGVERSLNLRVEIRVADNEPDKALDDHYAWVVRAMRSDPTWDGLALDTQESGSSFDAADLGRTVGACAVDWEITYITDEDDPEEGGLYG